MVDEDGRVHLDEEQASGGSKEGVVRWMLLGGMLLAIILLSITWIVPAMTKSEHAPDATTSSEIAAEEIGTAADGTTTDMGMDEHASRTGETVEEDGLEVIEN